MKKRFFLLCSAFFIGFGGCGTALTAPPESEISGETVYAEAAENPFCTFQITAGDTVLTGVLFDNDTAREFAERLPLTVPLWEPADFAKAFRLDAPLYDPPKFTWDYAVGGLAYWHAGPAVAIFHGADRDRTVVPIVPIGLISEDVGLFADYLDEVTMERVEENILLKE